MAAYKALSDASIRWSWQTKDEFIHNIRQKTAWRAKVHQFVFRSAVTRNIGHLPGQMKNGARMRLRRKPAKSLRWRIDVYSGGLTPCAIQYRTSQG
jgi:hypothetical protein